nr:hypothetical protein [Micromonospora chaiyaphumensis]
MAEGTVLTSVTGSRSAPGAASASTSSTSSTRPPQQSGPKISNTDRSKQTEVAASRPPSSASSKVCRTQCMSTEAERCSMATPLGRPVDPEV